MSAEGVKILDHDFACDVHDDFFERYDNGAEPTELGATLAAEYEAEFLSVVDREIFVATLAECLWSVGAPVGDLPTQLETLLTTDAGAEYWGELYPARKRVLKRLLAKLQAPKEKPVPRKKTRVPKNILFAAGDYLAFEKKNGKLVPVAVWWVETRGRLRYDFVFPNLGRLTDPTHIARFLSATHELSEAEIAPLFTKSKHPKVVTLEHKDVKQHAGRFHKFGNRPFHFPTWQCGVCGYCVRFEDFQQYADEGGSRALSNDELKLVGLRTGE